MKSIYIYVIRLGDASLFVYRLLETSVTFSTSKYKEKQNKYILCVFIYTLNHGQLYGNKIGIQDPILQSILSRS
jgi:hypothetical protein